MKAFSILAALMISAGIAQAMEPAKPAETTAPPAVTEPAKTEPAKAEKKEMKKEKKSKKHKEDKKH